MLFSFAITNKLIFFLTFLLETKDSINLETYLLVFDNFCISLIIQFDVSNKNNYE